MVMFHSFLYVYQRVIPTSPQPGHPPAQSPQRPRAFDPSASPQPLPCPSWPSHGQVMAVMAVVAVVAAGASRLAEKDEELRVVPVGAISDMNCHEMH